MGYNTEKNNQIVIALLKYHKIRKIIVSPGANNVSFVASVQNDPFFEIYSCVDERSAAYIACGMAAESGEAVVLSCTGATASRNYLPGLTEAYYRHLPVLAITSTMPIMRIGHNIPQCIDRTNVINDVAKLSVHIPLVKDREDEWICNIRTNEAILELKHNCPGPVHINLETNQDGYFDAIELPKVYPIDRVISMENWKVPSDKIAIFVGSHQKWDDKLTDAVDEFCEKYNAVVFHDHTSNYKGKYGCLAGIISAQRMYNYDIFKDNTVIHIGDISGAYIKLKPKEVWRISEDGKLCDTYRALRYVFEMSELEFFEGVNRLKTSKVSEMTYYEKCKEEYKKILNKLPELPFSNAWVAQQMSKNLPENSVIHLGILNSLRSWNFFEISKTICAYSNTGGFGIDGCVSSLLGAALMDTKKTFFGIVGDLAFFYDMNILGNRHVSRNIRILIINNGIGQEFKNYGHRAAQFEEQTNTYIAAAGHFECKSKILLKNYAENLGCEYMCASDKKSLLENMQRFTMNTELEKPIIFEVFTESKKETEAIKIVGELEKTTSESAKHMVRNILGQNGVKTLKKIVKK